MGSSWPLWWYIVIMYMKMNSKSVWLIWLLITASIFLIGLWLLDFSNMAFSSNVNAYMILIASACMIVAWICIRRKHLTLKNRCFILNTVIGGACLYLLLFVVLNIADSSLIRRLLCIIPPFCGIMFAITAKRDLKKYYHNNSVDSEQK